MSKGPEFLPKTAKDRQAIRDRRTKAITYLQTGCEVIGMAEFDLTDKGIKSRVIGLQQCILDLVGDVGRLRL